MIVLSSRKRVVTFWSLLFIFMLFFPVNLLAKIRLSIDSIFSGLLALTGFVFTARTFITFKLHEVVYGNPRYQNFVEKLRTDGAYQQKLYDPLKELDANLGNTTGMCLIAMALFGLVAILPDFKTIVIGANTEVSSAFEILRSKQNLSLIENNLSLLIPFLVTFVIDTAIIYFFFVLIQIYQTTISLNRNIRSIIDHWERDYTDMKMNKEHNGV